MKAIVALTACSTLFGGCAGPCKKVAADRAALLARAEGVAGPSARVRIPLALANKLIAQVVEEQGPIAFPDAVSRPLFGREGLRARVGELALVPGTVGSVSVDGAILIDDAEGHLITVRMNTKIDAIVEPGDPNDLSERPPNVAIAVRWDQVGKLDLELSDRAKAGVEDKVAGALPDAVKKRVPKILMSRGSAKIVERAAELAYNGLRDTLLVRLGEITKIRVPLPPMPVSKVDVAPVAGDVPAIDLLVTTQLPIRAPVGEAMPATADAINVEISGSAAAEAANWGIANGVAPARYNRELKPEKSGSYVPHFDWRPDRGDKPMVVHMFRVKGTCAHFSVAAQPHLEVKGDKIHAYVANKELEQADATLMFAALANVKDGLSSTTSETKKAPAHRTLRIGDRELTTRLTRATIGGGDLRAAIAVELGAKLDHHSFQAPGARSQTLAAGLPLNAGPMAWTCEASE
jgi:hypothetical protein